jgi:eukaryotic-like serine/threonine-protein kinase
MALRGRVWSAGRWLVIGAALLGTYFLFFVIAMRVGVQLMEVHVPPLQGRSVNEATDLLAAYGLALRVDEARRLDPEVPAGLVIGQDPPPGAVVRRQRSVRVWLSDGRASTVVPPLIGESERTAALRLQNEALELVRVSEIRSADYPAGVVVAQTPAPETRGTTVALMVNRGERGATYVMPDLIGTNAQAAAEALRSRGFRVTLVGEHPYPGVPPGIVLRQRPQGGFQVAPGDPISLEVSR